MASSTGHPAPVSRDTYWKRRAFVLAGVMLLLALITYMCRPSGEEGESSSSQAGMEEPEASPSVPAEEPSEPETEEPEDDPSEEDEDEDDEADEDEESDEDSEDGDSDEGSADVPAPERPEDTCRPDDVVVTFELADSDREVYDGGSNPEFKVTVVNIAEQTCTVDVGPEAMELRLHSGDDRVYSTADCVEGEATEERQLSQGRPHEYTLTWERDRSFTDCRDSSAKAQAGWYTANLHGDHVGSVDQIVLQLQN